MAVAPAASADPLAEPALASAVLALEIGAGAEDAVVLACALAALKALGVADARPAGWPMAEAGAALAFLARGARADGARAKAPALRLSRLGDDGPEPRGPVLVVLADGRGAGGGAVSARGAGACEALRPFAWLCPEGAGLPDLPLRGGAVFVVEPAR